MIDENDKQINSVMNKENTAVARDVLHTDYTLIPNNTEKANSHDKFKCHWEQNKNFRQQTFQFY